ncbi:MAG: hypothetical protein GY866_28240 [Proteobacteria bacterium]|nr:hypothetical protein [Pseudomonadota bacterium]
MKKTKSSVIPAILLVTLVQAIMVSTAAAEDDWTLSIGGSYQMTTVILSDEELKREIKEINQEIFGKDEEDFHGCGTKKPEFNDGGPFCITIFSQTEYRDESASPSVSLGLPDRFFGDGQFGFKSMFTYGSFKSEKQYIPVYDKWGRDGIQSTEAIDIGTMVETEYLMFTPTVFYSFWGRTPPFLRIGMGAGFGVVRIEGTFTNSYLTTFDTEYNETGLVRGETISFKNDTTLMTAGLITQIKYGIFTIFGEVQGVSKKIGTSDISYSITSYSVTLLLDIF